MVDLSVSFSLCLLSETASLKSPRDTTCQAQWLVLTLGWPVPTACGLAPLSVVSRTHARLGSPTSPSLSCQPKGDDICTWVTSKHHSLNALIKLPSVSSTGSGRLTLGELPACGEAKVGQPEGLPREKRPSTLEFPSLCSAMRRVPSFRGMPTKGTALPRNCGILQPLCCTIDIFFFKMTSLFMPCDYSLQETGISSQLNTPQFLSWAKLVIKL